MEVDRPIIKFVLNEQNAPWTAKVKNHSNEILRPNYLPNEASDTEPLLTLMQFGCLTGILLIFASNHQIDLEKVWSRLRFSVNLSKLIETSSVMISFVVFLLFVPLHLTIFIGFWIYKKIDEEMLKKNEKSGFKEYLSGEDVVWACENEKSKAVINILAFARAPDGVKGDICEKLLQCIRERVFTNLIRENPHPKLFYLRRKSKLGYFYWTDENNLTVDDYVRFTDDSDSVEEKSEEDFKRKVNSIANKPLPAGNTALWECLVNRKPVQVNGELKYPIIFRVHHAVGDGIALLRLVLETIADQLENSNLESNPNPANFKEIFSEKINRYVVNFITFIKMPSMLFSVIMKPIDENKIHPNVLTGNKKINWIYESDTTESCTTLLTLVKLLKRQLPGARFSNILLAALSKSLKDFFEKRNYEVPENMTVVIPARLYCGHENPQLKLENKFSVAMQTLPINASKMNERIARVRKYSDITNMSPDFLINFWLMSVLSTIFPEYILKVLMNSKHSTMAISNLPGPTSSFKICGFELENLGFFLPNIDQTACGLTILSYNNKMHFGFMADEAAIATEEDLDEILKGMVDEIHEMSEKLLENFQPLVSLK